MIQIAGRMVVLKQERMEAYQGAMQLSRGQKPLLAFEDPERRRQVQRWQINDLRFSEVGARNQSLTWR
jgi:hypothetical protein